MHGMDPEAGVAGRDRAGEDLASSRTDKAATGEGSPTGSRYRHLAAIRQRIPESIQDRFKRNCRGMDAAISQKEGRLGVANCIQRRHQGNRQNLQHPLVKQVTGRIGGEKLNIRDGH